MARTGSSVQQSVASFLQLTERTSLHAVASDGVLLHVDRYANPGGRPVLLLHGWMQSPRGMDSPVPGRSIARYLHAQGLDVFVGALRGHGDGKRRSGSTGHWTPGDHAALDLPAMVRLIRRMTGTAPALVGHSLGGLVSLLYAAGAVVRDGQVVPDARAAAHRNGIVPAVCAIAPPLAFPARSIGLFSDRPDLAGKLLCRFGASAAGDRLLQRLPAVRFQRAIQVATGARGVGRVVSAAMVTVARGSGSRGFWRPENMNREIIAAELTRTLDDTSGAELRQLARWVCQGGLEDQWRGALQNVRTRTLLVAGARDGVSTLDGIVQGSRAIGARDRRLLVVEDAGHNDLRVGDRAVTHVYPALRDWLV